MSITFSQLEKKIKSKEIDTVLVSLSDMQGRLVGKRVTGKAFLDYVHKETHFCNYLYTVDMICTQFQVSNLLLGKQVMEI